MGSGRGQQQRVAVRRNGASLGKALRVVERNATQALELVDKRVDLGLGELTALWAYLKQTQLVLEEYGERSQSAALLDASARADKVWAAYLVVEGKEIDEFADLLDMEAFFELAREELGVARGLVRGVIQEEIRVAQEKMMVAGLKKLRF